MKLKLLSTKVKIALTVLFMTFSVFVNAQYDGFFWCSVEGSPMGTEGIEVTIDGVTELSGFDGLALFEGLAVGDHDYIASFPGYVSQTGTITIVDQNVQEFVVLSPTYSVTIMVNDGIDPIENAMVNFNGNVAYTDDNGEVEFIELIQGNYDYTVSATGYYSGNGSVLVEDEDVYESISLTLITYSVTFIVNDGVNPIEGAKVNFHGDVAYTNVNGEAIYPEVAPGTYAYTISNWGYYNEIGTLQVEDENVTEIVSLTIITNTVTFVIDNGDETIEGAEINFTGITMVTNENGEAIYPDILPGNYSYTVSAEGYYEETGAIQVEDENVLENVTLTLVTYSVTFIIDNGMDPIEGAEVNLDGIVLFTDGDGQAIFTDIAPGAYSYIISLNGYIAQEGIIDVTGDDIVEAVTLILNNLIDNYFDDVNIYPNPSYGSVNIDNAKNSTIQIIDQHGAMILKEYIENAHSTINMTTRPAGMYNVILTSGTNVSSHKLLIVR